MSRSGGTYRLVRDDVQVTAGMVDFSAAVKLPEAAKTIAGLIKDTPDLHGCVLVLTGPFGLAKFDVLVEAGEHKLRRIA